MSRSPFDYVNSASYTKKNLMRDTDDDEQAEKDYNPWIVNLAFANHSDTIFMAQEMNQRATMPNRAQYECYLHGIRKRKRFGWIKNQVDYADIDVICEVYNCNRTRAKQYRKLIDEDQMKGLRKMLETGGRTK